MSIPIAFQFSKSTSKPKVLPKILPQYQQDERREETEYVSTFYKDSIHSSKKVKLDPKPLVIKLIKSRSSIVAAKSSVASDKDDKDVSLDNAAVKELIAEVDQSSVASPQDDSAPLMANSGPAIGLVPTAEDYESVPVEKFGRAMLRGMGLTNLPEPTAADTAGGGGAFLETEVRPRPKGLGLGASAAVADVSRRSAPSGGAANEQALALVPGACVRLTAGRDAGAYGRVESVQDGDGRCVVLLTLSKRTVSVPEATVLAVSRADYKQHAHVLNQAKYLEQKRLQQQTLAAEQGDERRGVDDDNGGGELLQSGSSGKRVKESKEQRSASEKSRCRADGEWVRAQLVVRCVDEQWARGRYYGHKLQVVDVVARGRCTCQTLEHGRLVEGVPTVALETVVPRRHGALVMIVAGRGRGELARVLQRDKARAQLTVQTVDDEHVLNLTYDDVCAYADH